MRHAFHVFAPYRAARKVAIFGSARTQPDDPLYEQARELAAAVAERDWMVITGAGPGIMEAGIEGAGAGAGVRREHPAAVRGRDHAVHRRRPEAHELPLLLHPQARVREGVGRVRAAPRRLRHARRGVRAAHAAPDGQGAARARSCCSTSRAARTGRRGRRSSTDELVEHRLHLGRRPRAACTSPTTSTTRSTRSCGFYANYHSLRFVDGRLVLRMQRAPTPTPSSRR